MMLVGMCLLGLVIHLAVYPFSLEVVITMIGTSVVLATVFRLFTGSGSRSSSSPPGRALRLPAAPAETPGSW